MSSRETPRRWMPSAWLDEMNTCLLESPDAFIQREGDGWLLRLPDDHEEADNDFYRLAVEPGQRVGFLWTEVYGDVELTVRHDRTWSTDYAVPPAATHFYEAQSGTIADSLEELVNDDDDPLEPGIYVVSCYAWAEMDHFFCLEVDTAGAGRFAPSTGAN